MAETNTDYPYVTKVDQPARQSELPWRDMGGADMGVLTMQQFELLTEFRIAGFDFFVHPEDDGKVRDLCAFVDQARNKESIVDRETG